MTQESVKGLSDGELSQVLAWAQQEIRSRTEKHKHATIARIRELARSIEVGVKIENTRGRPAKHGATAAR